MTEKTIYEYDYNEFISWACGYVLLGIGQGKNLRDLIDIVIMQVFFNKVFGMSSKNE